MACAQGIAKTVTKQRIESHFDLELRAAVMVRLMLQLSSYLHATHQSTFTMVTV